MADKSTTDEPDVLRDVLDALNRVDVEARERILKYVSDYFGLDVSNSNGPRLIRTESSHVVNIPANDRQLSFADRATISPKHFLHEKQPKTDIERVACLAYYLAHYLDVPHFKTIDISRLNTEAAQLKFSNPAYTVVNAANSGLLAPAGKGNKQISAIGERFVDALPNRDDAKAVLAGMRSARRRRKSSNTKNTRKVTK